MAAAAGGGSAAASAEDDPATLRQHLAQLHSELEALQGETPLVSVCVDFRVVSEVISAWTGIPVRKMIKDEIQTVLFLKTGSRRG